MCTKKLGVFVSILIFGVFWVTQQGAINRAPQSVTAAKNECNEVTLGYGVQNEMRLPPSVIYHYGNRTTLFKDVVANQIPISDWKKFIMGENSRFHLKPFRRGLYGCDFPEDADSFSDSDHAGLIAIKIKQECLVPEKVSSTIALATQTRFKEWFEMKEREVSLQEWTRTCYQNDGRPNIAQFQFYRAKEANDAATETVCEKIVNQFWQENNIALVHDQLVTRSWAVRDRNCIEGIDGNSEYWVKTFSEDAQLWENTCDVHVTHHSRARVWFLALSEKAEVLPEDFSLQKLLSGIKGPQTIGDKDFSMVDSASDFDETLQRCRKSGKLEEFKVQIRKAASRLDEMMSKDLRSQFKQWCL